MADNRSLTRDEKQALQQDKIQQMKDAQADGNLEMVSANRKPSLKIRKDEADGYVHVWTRKKHVDADAKSINNEDSVIMLHKNQFDQKVKEGYFRLYDDVEVIHDPRDNAPDQYNLKPNTPHKQAESEQLSTSNSGNAQLRERQKALQDNEKALIAKQDELDQREKAIADREAKIAADAKLDAVVEDTKATAPKEKK